MTAWYLLAGTLSQMHILRPISIDFSPGIINLNFPLGVVNPKRSSANDWIVFSEVSMLLVFYFPPGFIDRTPESRFVLLEYNSTNGVWGKIADGTASDLRRTSDGRFNFTGYNQEHGSVVFCCRQEAFPSRRNRVTRPDHLFVTN